MIITVFLLIPLVFLSVSELTPNPVAHLTRWAFSGTGQEGESPYPRVAEFQSFKKDVTMLEDVVYSSSDEYGKLDIHIPKQDKKIMKPAIFWVHGGAFVGGDKSDVADYMTMLASQGYVVVSINYDLAPEKKYPTPIIQIGRAFQYIEKNASKYGVDLNHIAFGGDSAGGQLIGQFVNLQVNNAYSNDLNIEPVVKAETIKAVVFFSALLNVEKFDETESELANYSFNKSAWAYFGVKQWKESTKVKQANITRNLDQNFPPVYITDGNTGSFQPHAEELAEQLKQQNVPVVTNFYTAELGHEYQFNMSYDQSQDNYKKVSGFLTNHLKQ